MHYRYRETVYYIEVLQTSAAKGDMRVTGDNYIRGLLCKVYKAKSEKPEVES